MSPNGEKGMKVVIACGASGGHIFPGIALGAALRRRAGARTLFVGSGRYLDRKLFEKEGVAFRCLSANKLPPRWSFASAAFLPRLAFDMAKSFFIILAFRPDVVVGFGGYVSFPVVAWARLMGIPVVIHEQNVTAGRANAALFRFARRIALSFDETVPLVEARFRGRCVVTGNPIRREFLKDERAAAMKELGLEAGRFTVLVIGGSQGSRRLNRILAEGLGAADEALKRTIQVVHIAGERDREWVEALYRARGVAGRVFSFVERIDRAYSAADLVITRSGAAALYELAFYGKPMVLIPYPYAMSHQKANALSFTRKGAAVCREEDGLMAEDIPWLVRGLMEDGKKREAMAAAARALSRPDAAERLAEIVIAEGKGRA